MSDSPVPELEHLTWTEAADLLSLQPVGLLPIGAIEAHGPHLPLNSDVVIAAAMAQSGGRQLYASGLPAIVLPAVSYSVSFAGACFNGTTPVTADAFRAYLADILCHHSTQGYRAICVCNAHLEPGHVEAVWNAVNEAQGSASIPIAFPDKRIDRWAARLGEEFQRGSRHAGCYETSIVMAAAPDQVRRTALEELEPVWIDLPAALRSGASDFADAGAREGYFGDPRAATAEQGEELLAVLGAMIRDSVLEAMFRPD